MALTIEEKSRIRYHLGFPTIGYTTVLALGFPAGGHPSFLLDAAMDAIRPEAEPKCREVLWQCECIEKQMQEARRRFSALNVGGIVLRPREEIQDLEDQYDFWTDALVDIFGVNKNPFSKRHQRIGGEYIVINPS